MGATKPQQTAAALSTPNVVSGTSTGTETKGHIGTGGSHKGSTNKSYSMYVRFLAMEDWFAGYSQETIRM